MGKVRMRMFQSWFRLTRPMTLGVRACVYREDGRVALVKHTYTPGWYFPGGGVERAETAAFALERELVEEVGVKITGMPSLVGVFSNHRVFPNDHVLFYALAAGEWTACEATSRGEIEAVCWVKPDAAPEDATPATRRRLLEISSAKARSDIW